MNDRLESHMVENCNLNLIAKILKDYEPKYSRTEFEALQECCEQLLNAYMACAEENSNLPLSLEASLSSFVKQIDADDEVAAFFGLYAFLESPDDEDNHDTYWDGYCDFVQNPKGVKKRIDGQM